MFSEHLLGLWGYVTTQQASLWRYVTTLQAPLWRYVTRPLLFQVHCRVLWANLTSVLLFATGTDLERLECRVFERA
jgi:hypothetical protein